MACEQTSKEQRIIYTRVWHPDTFVLDPVVELVVPGNDLEVLANLVEKHHGTVPSFPLPHPQSGSWPHLKL